MIYEFKILRTERDSRRQYSQNIRYEIADESTTVATVLKAMNEEPELTDAEGNRVGQIIWESSCLQKKCGACAMVINGRPALACGVRMKDIKGNRVELTPLRKFPVIEDLLVDRSILYENLKQLKLWLQESAREEPADYEMAYEGSRCLQCGCCLEVCPNFYAGGTFYGMAGMVPTSRLISEMKPEEQGELRKEYRKHIYEGCGKSLACRKICPAGLPIEELLVNSNAMAVWKRKDKSYHRFG